MFANSYLIISSTIAVFFFSTSGLTEAIAIERS
jgi:hypothetical protein